MSGEPVIETFELTRRFGELTAVDAVSLTDGLGHDFAALALLAVLLIAIATRMYPRMTE